jgi:hypothetical protein
MDRLEYKRQNEKRDARRKEKLLEESHPKKRWWQWRPTWWDTPGDRFAFFVAAFTGVLATAGYWQLTAMRGQLDITKRALIDVERPILSPGFPVFAVAVENVGKQIATIITGNANFRVQKDSNIPLPRLLGEPDGTVCHVRVVGEIAIKPNDKGAFVCQRSTTFTDKEAKGLEDGSLCFSFEYPSLMPTLSEHFVTPSISLWSNHMDCPSFKFMAKTRSWTRQLPTNKKALSAIL